MDSQGCGVAAARHGEGGGTGHTAAGDGDGDSDHEVISFSDCAVHQESIANAMAMESQQPQPESVDVCNSCVCPVVQVAKEIADAGEVAAAASDGDDVDSSEADEQQEALCFSDWPICEQATADATADDVESSEEDDQPEAQVAATAAAGAEGELQLPMLVSVEVPDASQPGDTLFVAAPDGSEVQVQVPMDYIPGQLIEIEVASGEFRQQRAWKARRSSLTGFQGCDDAPEVQTVSHIFACHCLVCASVLLYAVVLALYVPTAPRN